MKSQPTQTRPSRPQGLHELQQINLRDLLSEVSRKEKRTLLGASLVGIAIAQAGLIPTKISALGLDFSLADQKAILLLFAMAILYLLITFIVHAFSDFVAWRSLYDTALLQHLKTEPAWRPPEVPKDANIGLKTLISTERRQSTWMVLGRFSSKLRAFWEFAFPILLASYAFVILILARHNLA